MKKNKYMLILLVLMFFIIISGKLIFLNVSKHEEYVELLSNKTEIYVLGSSAPRGRILDRNGKVLVDNVGVNTLFYNKIKGIKRSEELVIALQLANIITIKEGDLLDLKAYWLALNNDGRDLITEEEYELVEMRKLKVSELKNKKLERITMDMLNEFDSYDRKAAYIYSLMNNGYMYQKKEIIKDISMEEYAMVMESNIPGITGEVTWQRVYNYPDTLRSIMGNINNIPKEEKDSYLNMGYELTDVVGISFLEREYEEYLQGQKAKYLVNNDYTLTLVHEARKGYDLVLSIDIDMQLKVDQIIKDKILLGKSKSNTEYYRDSYAIVSNPLTGEIMAISGQRYNDDKTFSDITSNIISSSYTIGSAVKGATIAVGYKNNLIDIGEVMNDSCVKLHLVPEKCSHKKLGKVDDTKALALSSNYYQYMIAMRLVGKKYTPNMVLGASKEHFDIYRETLSNFGLGALTGIDLPGEQKGILGSVVADDLLLNLAIGQYDTYTPIEMVQYINSIASKNRLKPALMKSIMDKDNVIVQNTYEPLNEVDLDDIYLDRIRLGMQKVLKEGTGRGFTAQKLNAVGKTGTSESFYDSDNDGKADVATITSTFAGYFPSDNPKFSIVVITPNISHKNGKDGSMYYGASKITRDITDFLFENY